MPKLVVLASWLGFFGYWALSARSAKRAAEQAGRAALLRFRLFLIGSFVLLAGVIPLAPFNIPLWRGGPALNTVQGAAPSNQP